MDYRGGERFGVVNNGVGLFDGVTKFFEDKNQPNTAGDDDSGNRDDTDGDD